jgi:hypothetical protein
MVPADTEVEVDSSTAESLIRAKLAEEIKPLPKIETPKKRYKLDPDGSSLEREDNG